MQKVLVIIPAYNEEASIEKTVKSIIDAGYDYVIINDGSKDSTEKICADRGFNIVTLPQNLGIGGAIQTGHKYALANGYTCDIQVDGDGQHDPKYIKNLVKKIDDGFDLAIGSRFLTEDEGFKSTFMRRVGIKWLRGIIKIITGENITDPTSGFRASGIDAIRSFSAYYPTDYPEPESIVCLLKQKLNVCDVPVKMHERAGGVSSINAFKSVYYMLKVTIALFIAGSTRAGVRE